MTRHSAPKIITVALAAALGVSHVVRAQDTPQPSKFTLDGDTALWTVEIRPDKTADFERVMNRLHEALVKSTNPERRQQGAGWRVVRLSAALPDANVAYVHVVHPVVAGADYTVMRILYDEFPDERQTLYDLYRGAFAKNLSLATGSTVTDMSQAVNATTASPSLGR